ncbi:MAG: LLM class flavin-dependent oxidoreductase [Ilumatobacteraceae bacterium]
MRSDRPSGSATPRCGRPRPTAAARSRLAWWGAHTSTVQLGTGIIQMSARTPAATAMAAMTLDHLSEGRVILGLGASGPQVVESWYGQAYGKPLARTRECVDIVRRIVRREQPVEAHGEFYDLPYSKPDGRGLGKALKSTIHPYRTEIPIYLGAEARRTWRSPPRYATAGCRCSSARATTPTPAVPGGGFGAAGDPGKVERFDVASGVQIIIGDDVERCADASGRSSPVRRRHGARCELPFRGVRADGLRGRGGPGAGPTSPARRPRRRRRSRSRWWKTSPSSARSTRSAPNSTGGADLHHLPRERPPQVLPGTPNSSSADRSRRRLCGV